MPHGHCPSNGMYKFLIWCPLPMRKCICVLALSKTKHTCLGIQSLILSAQSYVSPMHHCRKWLCIQDTRNDDRMQMKSFSVYKQKTLSHHFYNLSKSPPHSPRHPRRQSDDIHTWWSIVSHHYMYHHLILPSSPAVSSIPLALQTQRVVLSMSHLHVYA